MDQEEDGVAGGDPIALRSSLRTRRRPTPHSPPAFAPDRRSALFPATEAPLALALFALDARSVPAAFLDDCGRISGINREAEAILGAGLRVNNGRLFSEDRQADAELRRIIGVLATPAGASLIEASPVMVARPGRRALLVEVLPTARSCPEAGPNVVALLLITDLERQVSVAETVLRTAFGLTSAEARLAKFLGEGNDLQAVCGILGIATETARTQLKAVFGKTQTHRQSELVSLLSRFQSSGLDPVPRAERYASRSARAKPA
jgi:DNA-binding CsgD family transcriptional regulator